MHRNRDTRTRSTAPLDPSLLTVASLASVCSAVVASAFGTGPVATLVVAAVAPWIVAFISHPGPRRHRRVAAVLFLAGIVHGSRTGLARAASYLRHPRDRAKRRAPERSALRSVAGHSVPRRLSLAGATTIAAVAISALCLTVPELVFGAAVVADRPLTLLPIEHRADGPGGFDARDRPGPTISVPGGAIRRLATGPRGARVTYQVVARDAHGAALTPECRPVSGRLFLTGQTPVTCVATQADGTSVRRRFTVTVVPMKDPDAPRGDATSPRVTTPGDIVRGNASGGAVRVTFAASAFDGRDGSLTPSCRPASGAIFAVGATRVTCSAIDSAGNTGVASFTVTVRRTDHPVRRDAVAPKLSLPRAVQAQARSPRGAVVTYAARAVDARDGAVSVACAPKSGTRFPVGRTSVRCTATDRAGNTARGAFPVVVSLVRDSPDRTAPRIAVPRFVRGQTSSDGAVIRYGASATDDRDGRVAVTCKPASGATFRVGVTRVRCTASDRAGNTGTRSFAVVVMRVGDKEKPPGHDTPDPGPTRPGGEAGGGGDHPTPLDPDRAPPRIGRFWIRPVVAETMKGATVTFRTPTAVDDRDGAVPVHCEPESGSWFPVGAKTVTCTAQDKAGNTAQRTALARVAPPPDTEPPRIDPFTIPTVTAETGEGAIVTYDTPAADDDRDGRVPVKCFPPSGSPFAVGSTPVTCTAHDRAGNTANLTVTATVNPPPDPGPDSTAGA
jgi:hypothetical protein